MNIITENQTAFQAERLESNYGTVRAVGQDGPVYGAE